MKINCYPYYLPVSITSVSYGDHIECCITVIYRIYDPVFLDTETPEVIAALEFYTTLWTWFFRQVPLSYGRYLRREVHQGFRVLSRLNVKR
ncbi:hypothetical protein MBAV_005380 [Candidatus Magnetobacterium bavaricum]|uniref:Uncharacterized protein n=1 Tax=Candidatus Magnetobacterium bavaricum TaxID=29290 RepID=A0A0F3GP28_9BACT|nr:hypothetical protein MBAV_005380 [Candidatus Magnetobacterium bavaricum]